MTNNLLRFIEIDQSYPNKREPNSRKKDFGEIYDDYSESGALNQASRCSQCGVPFCQIHCPLHNNIPDWLMMTAQGRLKEAY